MTLSDSSGYIYDEAGIDREKLDFVMELKNVRRGRIKEYADKFKTATYIPLDPKLDYNPLWNHKAHCAFPSATQNEINAKDAANLLKNGVYVVAEGANMPTTLDGVNLFLRGQDPLRPGQGGQRRRRRDLRPRDVAEQHAPLAGRREEVDKRLHGIMKSIHKTCCETAERFGTPGNYVNGANIAGFLKVADAMMDQGVV